MHAINLQYIVLIPGFCVLGLEIMIETEIEAVEGEVVDLTDATGVGDQDLRKGKIKRTNSKAVCLKAYKLRRTHPRESKYFALVVFG